MAPINLTDPDINFIDVGFELKERKDKRWDLHINNKIGNKITTIGPLSWDDAVRECNKCIRLRFDFLTNLIKEIK